MDRPTIWIINESGHPYHKALDLIEGGVLRPLTVGDINPLAFDRMTDNLARGIVRYVKPDDYALIAGTPVLNAVAVLLWVMHHGKCKILQWNAKSKEYERAEITREDAGILLEREMIRGIQ